jgi:LDH2 family malate/lactate/ureidoglycolate dehydrogenase
MHDHAAPVPADKLRAFTRDVFCAVGMPTDDAHTLADHLVWAELRGKSWLGMRKVPRYVAQVRAGRTSPGAAPDIVHDRGAFVVIDAKDTFGQVVGVRAMDMATAKARSFGVGVAVVRNTTSAGALGYYADRAAAARMIGLAVNNGSALQPAWGGVQKVIGNQAFALGCPAGRYDPLLLDMATSAMSWVGIHEYEMRGEPLPEGVALSADGQPTVDPATALAGMLLPMGGHRGFGLSVLWEVLTGALSGGLRFADLAALDETVQPSGTSILCLAIDPEFAMPYHEFVSRVDEVIETIRSSRRGPGVDRIVMPGERGYAATAEHARDGIRLSAEVAASLIKMCTELSLPWPP